MSCGSRTFTSTDFPHALETAKLPSCCRPALRILGAVIDREQRRQLRFELEKARQRGLLKEFDDRLLADIGVTHEQAEQEARKPFWR
jgi:uncharacterized protein YjiS (DUF1127 family)